MNWDSRGEPARAKKYTYIERSYEESSSEGEDDGSLPGAGKRRASKDGRQSEAIESRLPGAVQRLMQLIFNEQNFDQAMAALDYDADKMPLGKLSKTTLKQGYGILQQLAGVIGDATQNKRLADLSNSYFSTIPHSFGRNRP